MCLDPARLSKVYIRLVHRRLALNDILPRPVVLKYLTLIDANLTYLNLKLDKPFSYLITFSCPFDRYRYIQLLFGVATLGDIFWRKIDKVFQGLPNVFGIADDMLIAGVIDLGKEHNMTLDKVSIVWREANVKFNRDKCFFRCTSIPFFNFWKTHIMALHESRSQKSTGSNELANIQMQKELQSFMDILNYLSKFPPVTVEVGESSMKLTFVKSEWPWNRMYQNLYNKAKKKITKIYA